MSEETWHGIPRKKIPWYPKINYEKCKGCGKCVDYCKLGVFGVEKKDGKKKYVVRNPNNCVVFCMGCDDICPSGAIEHQSRKETRKIIQNLRRSFLLNKN